MAERNHVINLKALNTCVIRPALLLFQGYVAKQGNHVPKGGMPPPLRTAYELQRIFEFLEKRGPWLE